MPKLLIEIVDGIAIDGFLPDANLGSVYAAQLTARNATGNARWYLDDGTLPPGWSLGETSGLISGDAEDGGSYDIRVLVIDDAGAYTTRRFTWRVQSVPLSIVGVLADMTVGTPVVDDLTIVGGAGSKSITAITVPAGVTYGLAGGTASPLTFGGAPTGVGLGSGTAIAFDVSVTVEDSSVPPESATFTQTVTINVAPLTLTGLPTDAQENTPYSFSLTRAGGIGDITETAESGFPSGISAAVDNPNDQVDFSGTPPVGQAALSPFVPSYSVVDAEGNVATWNGSIVVNPIPYTAYQTLTWTGDGTGSRVLTTTVDLSSGGFVEFFATGATLCQGYLISADGTTTYRNASANVPIADGLTSTNVAGFSMGAGLLGVNAGLNQLGVTYYAYIHGKKAGFCDVVAYTGNGAARTVAHSLGAAPAWWHVLRRSSSGTTYQTFRNAPWGHNNAAQGGSTALPSASTAWNNTAPTATDVSLSADSSVNASGGAFLMLMLCEASGDLAYGNYVGNGATPNGPSVVIGFQPQRVTIRGRAWLTVDDVRTPGLVGNDNGFQYSSAAAFGGVDWITKIANGFKIQNSTSSSINENTRAYAYLAFKP